MGREVRREVAARDLARRPPQRVGRDLRRAAGLPPQPAHPPPVRSSPRSTGWNASRATGAPASAAIAAAATSACCVARPPCLMADAAMSPTAKTSLASSTRMCSSTGRNPSVSLSRPGGRGPTSRGSAITRSAGSRSAPARSSPSANASAPAPVWRSTPASASSPATASLTSAPNTSSGACSGVTSATSADGAIPREHGGGLERELVGGQRPGRPGRHRERDAPDRRPLQPVDHGADARHVLRPTEREGAADALDRARAQREHERVVAQLAAALGVHRPVQ